MSSKLSVGIHLMTIFALKPGEPMTSEFLSCSVNTNPVVIRRLLGTLREAGIVESKTGVGGGWSLLVDPSEITLHIQAVLTEAYAQIQEAMTRELAGITIACIAGKIVGRMEPQTSTR